METKYTRDGKKVVVIGQLNNVEFIVQEIFITNDGSEIPSGEKFTTKTLLDEPMETWEFRNIKKLKDTAKTLEKNIESIRKKEKECKFRLSAYCEILKQTKLLKDNLSESNLETLAMFMSGKCEWVVDIGYSLSKPVKLLEAIANKDHYDRASFDSIKLITLAGKSNGNTSFNIGKYSDGSGGYSKRDVKFFEKWDDAVSYLGKMANQKADESDLSFEELQLCEELNIEIRQENLIKIIDRLKEKTFGWIEKHKKDSDTTINNYRKDIAKLDILRV